LKESLGTQAPSYKTVCLWVNTIKNGPKEIDDAPHSGPPTSAMDEHHMEQVKSVLEHTCSILCMAIATEVKISPASVCLILISSLGKRTGRKGGFHT